MASNFLDCILPYLYQTVTVYTASGGLSGSGISGVLTKATPDVIVIECEKGAGPSCPVGSGCSVPIPYYQKYNGNPLGADCEIPFCNIVAFVHHSI